MVCAGPQPRGVLAAGLARLTAETQWGNSSQLPSAPKPLGTKQRRAMGGLDHDCRKALAHLKLTGIDTAKDKTPTTIS